MPAATIVVVGAGQAGCQTAASLRERGFAGRIVVVGDEDHLPYQRPPLSKGHITAQVERKNLWLHPESYYAKNDIELRLSTVVSEIDRSGKAVVLASGERLPYDHLVLALGSRNRPLCVDGGGLDGVVALRTLDEADEVRDRLTKATNVVVVGGGFIGMEIAATAAKIGLGVTVVEVADRLMGRVLSDPASDFLLTAHRSRGLQVELRTSVTGIEGDRGVATGVHTADGRHFPADLVVVGIGAIPNVELAVAAGLPTGNGIVVNEFLETEDPNISAVGDCASFPSAFADAAVRLESVQNATAQPRALAARLAGGPREPYEAVPWFWSDQADLKIQIAGFAAGHPTAVTRGDIGEERFSVFCFDSEGRLRGVESVNKPGDHMAARRLISARVPVTPEQVRDPGFDPRALASGRQTTGSGT
ncbi:MAG TPA: FAD-dependent oxidoreductase [Amycolatopsis sp.]|nr:FAD-dependent oxidoreductase [Amycolatopsis sp.]